MMKKMLLMIGILALSLPLGLTGCNRGEMKNLQDELAQTRKQRDAFEAKMHVVTQTKDELQEQVEKLTKSLNQLKAQLAELNKLPEQVDELNQIRAELQNKNDSLAKSCDAAAAEVKAAGQKIQELTESRDTAVAEAQAAKVKIDELAKRLEAEKERVRVLEKQLKQVQAALTELQRSIKM